MLRRPVRYLETLTAGRVILWCYAIWWLINVANYFDPRPSIWLTAIGLSGIVGAALYISTRSASRGVTELDGWQVFRLFLMPFCVSSFAALVKGAGFILIFPPSLRENLVALGCICTFLALVRFLKCRARRCANVAAT